MQAVTVYPKFKTIIWCIFPCSFSQSANVTQDVAGCIQNMQPAGRVWHVWQWQLGEWKSGDVI